MRPGGRTGLFVAARACEITATGSVAARTIMMARKPIFILLPCELHDGLVTAGAPLTSACQLARRRFVACRHGLEEIQEIVHLRRAQTVPEAGHARRAILDEYLD